MKKLTVLILTVVLCITLVSCTQTENVGVPFESSEVETVEMFQFIVPADAEKKVITEQEDIEGICKSLESISVKDKETESVCGGPVTSFRFNLSDGTAYEIIYSEAAGKSGRIYFSNSDKDYFTSADIGELWYNYDYEIEKAPESELPVLSK